MDKFIKKYWFILLIFFGGPVFALFYLSNQNVSVTDSMISIACAVLTYYGTIILAFVTILQNDKITEISERTAAIEEIQIRNKYHPIIDIESIEYANGQKLEGHKIHKTGFGTISQVSGLNSNTVYVVLRNNGNSSAFNVELYEYGYINTNGYITKSDYSGMFDYGKKTIAEILSKESYYLELHIENDALFTIQYNLCYQNEFGHNYHNGVMISMIDDNGEKTIQVGLQEQSKEAASFDLKEFYLPTGAPINDLKNNLIT